jgi:hypothetical protein
MRASLTVVLALAALALIPAAGVAATTHSCGTVDRTNPALKPDPKGLFGIFGIKATGVACSSAKVVAGSWYTHEVLLPDPKLRLVVKGWGCTATDGQVSQQVSVICEKASARIRFRWEVANG